MARRETKRPVSRAKHQKSRRGCATCKTRRVRCDETFPHCRNCASSDRVCDGVSPTQFVFVTSQTTRQKSPIPVSLQPSIPRVHRPDPERRSFNFFLINVAPLFAAGSLDSAFWSTLVPQLSRVHPTVWDAVISIALLFEHPMPADNHSNDGLHRNVNPEQLQALKWYSRAVSRITNRMEPVVNDEATALLTCILFVAFEFQQGNMRQAWSLVEQGIELAFTYFRTPATCEKSPEAKAIAEVVVPFFSRQSIFMATLGLPLLSGWPHAAGFDQTLESEQAALHSFDGLLMQLHSLIHRAHYLIRSTMLILHDERELKRMQMDDRQRELLAELTDWYGRFSSMEDRQKPEHAWISTNVLTYYLVTRTWISSCLSRQQMAFDSHAEAFDQIVYNAALIVDKPPPSLPAAGLNVNSHGLGTGCIPPLYFTATKCRDPVTRRWALKMIRRAPKGTSIWARIPTEAILEKLIAFEESTPKFIEVPSAQIVPPEHRRVHHVQLLAQGDSIRLFTFAQGHPGDPKHIQAHIVGLKNGCLDQDVQMEAFDDQLPALLLMNERPTMSDLFGNLTASDDSPKSLLNSTSSPLMTPASATPPSLLTSTQSTPSAMPAGT
jgi:Fungal specific transcription factor domain/Fungal Zn(2)-Cys(6) binuclear cluster domain